MVFEHGTRALTRSLAVAWIAAVATLCLGGVGRWVADEWRGRATTTRPTAANMASFTSHGRTYFVPEAAARWHDRFALAQGVAAIVAVGLLPVSYLAMRSRR